MLDHGDPARRHVQERERVRDRAARAYAQILISVNGGAPQRGGVEASFGDTRQLYAESTIGWSIPAAVWEITTYPSGWPAPAGWSVDPVTKAYFILGNLSSLPPFQLPAASTGLWGKWKFRLRINGGGGALTDVSAAVEIVSPNGVHDLAASEGTEFGAERGWPGPQQQNLRLLDKAAAVAGSTVTSIGATPPLEVTGPSNAPVLGIALVTPSADGAMLHADKTKLDGATPSAIPSTLVARDNVGGSTLHVLGVEAGVTFSSTGSFSLVQTQAQSGAGTQASIRAQQGAAGQSGGALLLGGGDAGTPGQANTWAGGMLIQLGQPDAATQTSAALQLLAGPPGAFLSVVCKGSAALLTATQDLTLAAGAATVTLSPAGLVLAVTFVEVTNASAPPTTNPSGGVTLYADTGTWKARSTGGVVTTMVPTGAPGPQLQVLDVVAGNVKTGSNAAQILLSYAVPLSTVLELDVSIQARNAANGAYSWFRRIVRVKRATAAPVIKSVATPVLDDDESGGLAVAPAINGSNVEVTVAGLAGTTIAWFGSARVQVFGP